MCVFFSYIPIKKCVLFSGYAPLRRSPLDIQYDERHRGLVTSTTSNRLPHVSRYVEYEPSSPAERRTLMTSIEINQMLLALKMTIAHDMSDLDFAPHRLSGKKYTKFMHGIN